MKSPKAIAAIILADREYTIFEDEIPEGLSITETVLYLDTLAAHIAHFSDQVTHVQYRPALLEKMG